MRAITIHITFKPDLLKALDTMAKAEYATRSEFIRQAIIEKMHRIDSPQPAMQIPTGKQELQDLFNEVWFA